VLNIFKGVNMIQSNLEAAYESKLKELEEVKKNIAWIRNLISNFEQMLERLNSDYCDLKFDLDSIKEEIEEVKEDYED